MAKSSNDATRGANCKKYGVPFYGVAFVPRNAIKSLDTEPQGEDAVDNGGFHHVVFAGGGGEGRSGIPNALIISHFDPASNYRSDQPVSLRFPYNFVS